MPKGQYASESDYPICGVLGLSIYRGLLVFKNDSPSLHSEFVRASELERLLNSAPRVQGFHIPEGWIMCPYGKGNDEDTHGARLLAFEEIKKDTSDDILREMIQWIESDKVMSSIMGSVVKRARKVLEAK